MIQLIAVRSGTNSRMAASGVASTTTGMTRLLWLSAWVTSSLHTPEPTEWRLITNRKTSECSIATQISSHHFSPAGIRAQSIHVSSWLCPRASFSRRAKAMSFRE